MARWVRSASPMARHDGLMRLIHTADIHLDHSFASEGFLPRLGNRRRQSIRQAFQHILDRAGQWPADAILIAGDLFEQDYVTRDTVAFVLDAFKSLAPIPIFIAPGNQDPFVPESPYAMEQWPDHVHIFREPRWTSVEVADKLVVHGFGFDGTEISRNPFGELAVPSDGRVHIGIAHASEVNHLPHGQKLYCPFRMEDGMAEGLHYLALGHYHVHIPIPAGYGVAAYPGAPEAFSFRDRDAGHYIEVEATPEDVVATPVRVGTTSFREHAVDCTGLREGQELIEKIHDAYDGDDKQLLLRVTLEGVCDPAIWAEADRIRETLQNRFEHIEILDRTEPMEDFESLSRENTSLGSFAATILDEIRTTPAGARRQMLLRARDAGLAAFRNWDLPVRGLGRE